ncbi:MAG TPA: ABC transporter permease [Conexibacter sp.]|jgi:NitT/TauT family transport system permease protein/putative hydroxymethylpyrimidine transport system permease protein|nr:ABC transporter permease [Conexibacter sp.]
MSGARGPADEPVRTGGVHANPYAWMPTLLTVIGWSSALLILLALFGAWELYAVLGPVDPLLLPPPHDVARALYEDRALLWENFTVTAGEVLLGILVAGAAGFACAIALHLSLALRRSVYPLLVASQAIPIVLVAPLLVAWLGFGIAPKLVIIALVSFFPIVVTTLDALARVDAETIKLLRTLDAPRMRVLRHVELPAALPGLFSGAKVGIVVAVIGAVFAEYAGSSSGLGHLIQQAIPQLFTARAFAAVIILSAFAIALFGLITLAERLLVPWAHQPPGGNTR